MAFAYGLAGSVSARLGQINRLVVEWTDRPAAGPMEEMPTYRDLSLDMICKAWRISKLTPSAVPSLVARGFRDSYPTGGSRRLLKRPTSGLATIRPRPPTTPFWSYRQKSGMPVRPNGLLPIGGLSQDENDKVGNAQFVIGVSV